MYRRILVPVDDTDGATRPAEHAARLAAVHDAELHVVGIAPAVDTGDHDALGLDAVEQRLAAIETWEGEHEAAETVAALDTDSIDVSTDVVTGTTHRAICAYVDQVGADLVVIGAPDRSLGDYVLRSTSERVVRECDVPVLVV